MSSKPTIPFSGQKRRRTRRRPPMLPSLRSMVSAPWMATKKRSAISGICVLLVILVRGSTFACYRTEPPSLFRGRGEHPKQGMIKRRIMPEDVTINCSKDSKIPKAPDGHKWKKVQHDNSVTWLASWTENIQGQIKYIMLNPSSRLKGEKDWQKYEKARKLKGEIEKIREDYMADMKSKEMRVRQRAVALYFIDKLALR